jgi:hypothetical protein
MNPLVRSNPCFQIPVGGENNPQSIFIEDNTNQRDLQMSNDQELEGCSSAHLDAGSSPGRILAERVRVKNRPITGDEETLTHVSGESINQM